MKNKILLISAIVFLSQMLYGQVYDDALRYSKVFYQGTARFTGMSGAFTALGGDLSAVPLNPASGSLIRSFEFAVTPQLVYNNTTTTYKGDYTNFTGKVSDFSSTVALGQIGFVSSLKTGLHSSLNFAYTYNKTNDFNTRATIKGVNLESSMADYWATQANGHYTGDLADNTRGGYMAYQTYLIDTLSGSYDQYQSVFSVYGDGNYTFGQHLKRVIDNSGRSGEHTFALSTNIGDKVYIGASMGLTTLKYTGHYTHSEWDESGTIPLFGSFTYTDHFYDEGNGVNFKFGMIVRPVETVRFGLSFHSPTWYNIDETYYSNLTSAVDYFDEGYDREWQVSGDRQYYSYKLRTPARVNAGIAVQLGSSAIISGDYEFVDYSTAKMSGGSDGYNFDQENEDIKSNLKSAGNLRLGAEYRLGSLYLRGGYSYYGSAFRSETLNSDNDFSGYSLGLGYRQKNFYLDFAFSGQISSEKYIMYPDEYDLLDPVTIDNNNKSFSATIGFKF